MVWASPCDLFFHSNCINRSMSREDNLMFRREYITYKTNLKHNLTRKNFNEMRAISYNHFINIMICF